MNKFLTTVGRSGHALMQVALIALQVYIAWLQHGQVGAVNAGILALQAALADQAYTVKPPD